MKNLSIETGVFLMVFLLALGGFFSLSSENINDLSGFQTASSVSSTGLYNGLPQKVIELGTSIKLDKINGQTCYYHKKTGSYYRFVIEGYDKNSKKFRIEYPPSPNFFGGKGGRCSPISLDMKPYSAVDKIIISGVVVKGGPNSYNNKFDVLFAKTQMAISPTFTQQKGHILVISSQPETKIILDSKTQFITPKNPNGPGKTDYSWRIVDLTLGQHTLKLSKIGYADFITSVNLRAGDVPIVRANLNIVQKPIKTPLPISLSTQKPTLTPTLQYDPKATIISCKDSDASPEYGKELFTPGYLEVKYSNGYISYVPDAPSQYPGKLNEWYCRDGNRITGGPYNCPHDHKLVANAGNVNVGGKNIVMAACVRKIQSCKDSDVNNNPLIAGYLELKMDNEISYRGDKIEGSGIFESVCAGLNISSYTTGKKVNCPSKTKPISVELTVGGKKFWSAKCAS